MHTWAGFLRIVTAQGLRGNLLGFTPGQILQRLWDVRVPLLRQFSLPGLLLIGLGWGSLWWPKRCSQGTGTGPPRWVVALLLSAYLACVTLITVNVLQDAVAYLLGPMAVFAVFLGLGVRVVMRGVGRCVRGVARASVAFPPARRQRTSDAAAVAVVVLVAVLPFWALGVNWARMDLSSFRDAEDWLAAVEERFVGQGQHAVVLAEWERMTTVYYKRAVEGREWSEEDLRFVPISAGTEAPFLHAAETYLAQGPVYLTMYRPQVAARYRLLPVPLGREFSSAEAGWSGTFWQVLPAWPRELPVAADGSIVADEAAWASGVSPVSIAAGQGDRSQIEIVGWRLVPDQGTSSTPRPGDILSLDLFMRLPPSTPGSEGEPVPYYLPWVRWGEATYLFTTDSRFNTPRWQPGEIVVERFELPVPWLLLDTKRPADGRGMNNVRSLALEVGMMEVSQGRGLHVFSSNGPGAPAAPGEAGAVVTLTSVPVAAIEPDARLERQLDRALGNLRGEILLRGARIDGRRVGAHGDEPFALRPGQKMRVVLEWQSLRPIGDNYKVFVQLLDAGLQVRAQGDDKAPLGGSAPTLLWFPRWREGTRITDTYVLDVPPDLPSGTYPLIVGMYGFSTFRRLQVVSYDHDLGSAVVEGDWITLAHLQVK
jgi:hypothetical protein